MLAAPPVVEPPVAFDPPVLAAPSVALEPPEIAMPSAIVPPEAREVGPEPLSHAIIKRGTLKSSVEIRKGFFIFKSPF
jgi:hypothetical protein